MAQDIIDGYVPTTGPVNSLSLYKSLWEGHPFFADFPYDRTRYDRRLKTLRNQVENFKKWADYDSKALDADLQLYPNETDIRGEPRWAGSEAQAMLKEDVANKVHVGMKPKDLRLMPGKEEYQKFSLTKFRKHLDQAIQDEKAYVDNGHKYSKNIIGNKEYSRITDISNQI